MPDISPILGLPIAKGTDPLKQFPASVDSPRTLALEKATIPRFANAAARDAAIPGPVEGQHCYLLDLNVTQFWDGSAWSIINVGGLSGKHVIVATATTTITGTGGATINYGPWAGIPVVLAVLGDEAPATARYVIVVNSSVLTTSFGVRVKDANGANVTSGTVRINYIAVGNLASGSASTKPAGEET